MPKRRVSIAENERRALTDHMVRFALWAHSQSEPSAETWLKAAARTINDHDDAWGVEVRIKYLGQGNPLAPYIAADLRRRQERRGGVERQPRQSIRAVSVGGAHEVDIASRHYKESVLPPRVGSFRTAI
jgi:hypothetical protein